MTALLLARRFTTDVARNPLSALVLVATPVVFVVAAAGALAQAGALLGGAVEGSTMARLTAGWSAAFVTSVSMYFQISAARHTDRRLVGAGLGRMTLVAGRVVAGVVLAATASAAALLALVVRNGTEQIGRAAIGTLIFAAIYLGLGALVGAGVRDPINGTVILLFVWILDVFFGPGLNGSQSPVLRLLPTHHASLWMLEPPGAPGATGHLLSSGVWLGAALAMGLLAVLRTTATPRRRNPTPGAGATQLSEGLRMAWHSWRRTPVLWALLVAVPAVFIWLADATTPHGSTTVQVLEGGASVVASFDPADIHAGTMVPIAVASLAALAGVFIGVDARRADGRLALAGQRSWVVAATRLGTTTAAALLAAAAGLGVAATVFDARQWGVFALGNVLVALTYALLGLLVGPLVGRASGTLLAFLVPFVDLALGQSPMLHTVPPSWALVLPGYGGTRLVVDGGLTASFDEARGLAIAAAWFLVLLVVAVVRRPARAA